MSMLRSCTDSGDQADSKRGRGVGGEFRFPGQLGVISVGESARVVEIGNKETVVGSSALRMGQ